MSATAVAWLTLPPRAAAFGGIRWAHGADALEDAAGQTIALVEQLELVFDGLLSEHAAPHLLYVSTLLRAMKFGSSDQILARLAAAYAQAPGGAALARNSGVLIGRLCADLPKKLQPSRESLKLILGDWRRHGLRTQVATSVMPPLDYPQFIAAVTKKITTYSQVQLVQLLRQGTAEVIEDDRLPEVLETLPQRVRRLHEAAQQSPRLAGAASLLPVLDAALALPSRKRSPDALPQGGYADVTTRGSVDRLLPSQFAVDGDEFLRRFSENELLYFHREEPHETRKPERVIVLDQGVRTWGRVRHALAGGLLSLIRPSRKYETLRVFLTSRDGEIDIVNTPFETVVAAMEASDLTPHPASTFASVFDTPAADGREVILLTHPRNLPIPLAEAKRLRGPLDRIFALAVHESGDTRVEELLDDGVKTVRHFKLDLLAADAVTVTRPAAVERLIDAPRPWSGDVEANPFPFPAGILDTIDSLAFSGDEQWLGMVCHGGLLLALHIKSRRLEVLPRPLLNGKPATTLICSPMSCGATLSFGKAGGTFVFDFEFRSVRWSPSSATPTLTECDWGDGEKFESRLTSVGLKNYTPMRNGRQLLDHEKVEMYQIAGDRLLLQLANGEKLLHSIPDGRTIREYRAGTKQKSGRYSANTPWILSSQGQRFAFRRGKQEVVVDSARETAASEAIIPAAHLHNELEFGLRSTPFEVVIRISSYMHAFTLDGEGMHYKLIESHSQILCFQESANIPSGLDHVRFYRGSRPVSGLTLVGDRWGAVHLLKGTTLIASFCIRRKVAAAALPDGTGWGSEQLLGKPPHPKAAERIGAAIRAAMEGA